MAMKPKAPKPMGSGKKNPNAVRGRKLPGTPVPLKPYKPKRVPGQPIPVPLPKRVPNLSLPKDQQTKARPTTPGPKRKSPGTATPKPRVQKPKLDDFLLKGKRPPMKIKPGLKRPSDADVILKGYNDKKYKGK